MKIPKEILILLSTLIIVPLMGYILIFPSKIDKYLFYFNKERRYVTEHYETAKNYKVGDTFVYEQSQEYKLNERYPYSKTSTIKLFTTGLFGERFYNITFEIKGDFKSAVLINTDENNKIIEITDFPNVKHWW
jgi:hypothetical protein